MVGYMFIDNTKGKVMNSLKLFFQYEQGNRVTIFNMTGLISKIERDFKEGAYIESNDKKEGK